MLRVAIVTALALGLWTAFCCLWSLCEIYKLPAFFLLSLWLEVKASEENNKRQLTLSHSYLLCATLYFTLLVTLVT